MIISEKDIQFLKVDKKPEKTRNVSDAIRSYMDSIGYDRRDLCDCSTYAKFEKIESSTYAKEVVITRSGSEESIYSHVYDNNGQVLAWFRILDTSAESFGKIGAYSGLFMELYNKYLFINDI